MMYRILQFTGTLACAFILASNAIAQTNPLAENKRFIRVPANDPQYQSFVIPLDGQKGIALDPLGDNAAKFSGSLPWFQSIAKEQRRHLTQNPSPGFNELFENPIVAFGSLGGGTPLYTGQAYSFGIYGGNRAEGTNLETSDQNSLYYGEVYISVYSKASFTQGATNVPPLQTLRIRAPRKGSAAWNDFITKGYQIEIPPVLAGLEIFLKLVESPTDPFNEMWGVQYTSPMILTVKSASSDYFFLVETLGLFKSGPEWFSTTREVAGSNPKLNRLFTMDFENRPPWRSTFIHQPHFDGEPLPSAYQGKTLDELLFTSTPVTKQMGAVTPDQTALDNSPELRSHPILDKFVADMGNDPIALANYVLNEIELTDAISYPDDGQISDPSINLGGVNRGALATFLEGQGSPLEQCALLVYLLRKAGYPAIYVFPPKDELKMLDSRMSQLLRMQLKGLVNDEGEETLPTLISVNYPWVATYVPDSANPGQNKWVHLFPWLKDTEIKEGYNLYDFMPIGYRTGNQWMRKYLDRDNAIISLSSESDTVSTLFPAFINKELQTNHPELTIEDIGLQVRNRRHLYSRWEDFPQPWQVTENNGTMTTFSSLDAIPNIFDTVSIQVWSDRNNDGVLDPQQEPGIQTGEMRSLDVHNRRLLLSYQRISGDKHNMFLTLAPFRPGVVGTASFGASDPSLLKRQQASVSLVYAYPEDYNIKLKVTHKRHRSLPANLSSINRWDNPYGFFGSRVVESTNDLKRGDLAAICLNFGRVSQHMVIVHMEEFWAEEKRLQEVTGSVGDPEIMQGTAAYIMGMSYYEKVTRFQSTLMNLHKVNIISSFAHGLAKLGAKRKPNGKLDSNGKIILINPVVDMSFNWLAYAGNGTARPDLQAPRVTSMDDFVVVAGGDVSAQEHQSINDFFQQSDAVSTVKLFHLAKQGGKNLVELTKDNYASEGAKSYDYKVSKTKKITKTLTAWSGATWNSATAGFNSYWKDYQRALITPGPIDGAAKKYLGVGAFVMYPEGFAALITPDLNGGFGVPVDPVSFQSSNFAKISLSLGNNFTPRISLSVPQSKGSLLAQSITPAWNFNSDYKLISGGISVVSDYQTSYFNTAASALNYVPSGTVTQKLANSYQQLSNSGYAGGTSWFGTMVSSVATAISDPVHAVTGEFYVDALDLHLPGPMPLEIRRNYTSQNLADNEFGYGWKMAYFPYLVVSVDSNLIYAAEMDGSVIAYKKQSATLWKPLPADNPNLCNMTGDVAGSVANMFNATIVKTTEGADTIYTLTSPDGSIRRFKVRSFATAEANGLIRQRPYLEKWTDSQGNFYNFTFGTDATATDYGKLTRVASSSGSFVGFTYDTFGHVTEAFTGDGRRVRYRYDKHGDLIEVTLPDATGIGYDYEHATKTVNNKPEIYSKHLIIRERKPEGRILENAYDASRRVTQQKATVGTNMVPVVNATFTYTHTQNADKTITGNTKVKDAYNRETTYEYVSSQITKITDPLNQVISQQWYAANDNSPGAYPRSLKQRVDKRGLISNFVYDTSGNLVTQTQNGDLTGDSVSDTATTTHTYNALNLPTLSIDPVGNRIATFYEDATHPRLPTRIEKRSSNNTLISQTVNEYYDVVSGNKQARGLLKKVKVAQGSPDEAVTEWTHDARGFPLTMTQFTGTGDTNVVTNFVYNGRGEEIERRDAASRKIISAYDDIGRKVWEERRNEAGALLGWQYNYFNGNGELEWSDGPRYNPEDYIWHKYDGAGRPKEEIRWRSVAKADGSGVEASVGDNLYATTFFTHNLFGDLTEIRDPRGNSTVMTYDDIGQLLTRKFYEGGSNGTLLAQETFTREPGGEVANYTNPLGGLTKKFYTVAGQLRRQENPDGTILEWRYQLDGRVTREPVNHNTYYDIAYDDVARIVTKTLKTLAGATLATESKTFDRRGNCISETDRTGATTTTIFDGLNRVKTIAGPAGGAQQTITYTYDAAGKVASATNALGEKTSTSTDILGRTTSVEIRSAANAVVRRALYLYAADHNSITITEGTGANAITRTNYTDTTNAEVLSINGAGDKTITQRDQNGNPIATTDPLGRITKVSYDGLNRSKTTTLPDGASITLVRDMAGNILECQMPGGLTWKATYDNASRMLSEKLVNGGNETRQFGYAYYTSGPSIGLLQTTTDPRGVTFTHSYDDFLRPQTIAATGPAPEHNQSLSYGYDARGLTTSISLISSISATVNKAYDAYGQQDSETLTLGGVAHSSITQTWDAAGRRSAFSASNPQSAVCNPQFGYRADGRMTDISVNGTPYNFTYGDSGFLISRNTFLRGQTIAARDAAGRILTQTTTVFGLTVLSETQMWRADSTLSSYSATRTGANVWNETRDYTYNNRGQVLSESFAWRPGVTATLNYAFDFGAAGIGVRTNAEVGAGGMMNWFANATTVNSFSRTTLENVNPPLQVPANGISLGADKVLLEQDGVSIADATHPGWKDPVGAWATTLRLCPGEHELKAYAVHVSKWISPAAISLFNVTGIPETITNTFDEAGNITSRTWSGGKTQTLTWDAFGRLVKFVQSGGTETPYTWTAAYDGIGRRLQTVFTPQPGSPVTINSIYDPEVEFLEIGVAVNGTQNWKVYGPDLNGEYGSLNGMGGLEVIITPTESKVAVNDTFGNSVASAPFANQWNTTKVGSYGPLPNSEAKTLESGTSLTEATVWRTRRADPTGLIYLGARYYDPTGGIFISADPLGHTASMSLYDFANGDAVNGFDSDGRFGKQVFKSTVAGFRDAYYSFGDSVINAVPATISVASSVMGYGMDLMGIPNHLHQQATQINQSLSPYARSGVYNPSSPSAVTASVSTLLIAPEAAFAKTTTFSRSTTTLAPAATTSRFSQLREAATFLRDDAGITSATYRRQVIESFGGDMRVGIFKGQAYQYSGAAGTSSRYLTPSALSNPVSKLALPPSNTATLLQQYSVSPTRALMGTASPQNFGFPLPGGAQQIFIPSRSVLSPTPLLP